MPLASTKFELNDEEIEKLKQAILNCGVSSEKVINNYLHTRGSERITNSVTRFIPVSKKGKRHAKKSKWHTQTNYNLAVEISNDLKGKRGTSFYYLYYVVTGTGTSKRKGSNDFMEKGLNKEHVTIVNELIEEVDKNIEKEMN